MGFLFSLIILGLFGMWGYNAGKTRKIGSTVGLLLGLFLNIIGIVIVLISPKADGSQGGVFTPAESPADQLKKYKDLLDSGAITEAEFAVQKRRILGV